MMNHNKNIIENIINIVRRDQKVLNGMMEAPCFYRFGVCGYNFVVKLDYSGVQ